MAGQWVRLEEGYFRNPKARAVGLHGRSLHLCSLCWSAANLTDGHIPRWVLPSLLLESETKLATVRALVDVGLWITVDDGWVIKDFLLYQRSRAAVEREQAKWRRQKASQREKSTVDSTVDSTAHDTNDTNVLLTSPPPTHVSTAMTAAEGIDRINTIVAFIAKRETKGRGDNPGAYLNAAIKRIRAEHGERIAQLMARYPSAPVDVIAAAVEGDTHSLRYYSTPQEAS